MALNQTKRFGPGGPFRTRPQKYLFTGVEGLEEKGIPFLIFPGENFWGVKPPPQEPYWGSQPLGGLLGRRGPTFLGPESFFEKFLGP